jgi:hypothetical protein
MSRLAAKEITVCGQTFEAILRHDRLEVKNAGTSLIMDFEFPFTKREKFNIYNSQIPVILARCTIIFHWELMRAAQESPIFINTEEPHYARVS